MSYLFLKWAHIISIICWMAGILYLFRLFIYHRAYGLKETKIHDLLSLMEKRLLFYITKPAMLGSWVFGLWMIWENPTLFAGKWLHAKILLVIFLTVVTVYANILRRSFLKEKPSVPSDRALRVLNEVPTVLMLAIVYLVVFRPF